jgi:polyphenol oxidase
MRSEEREGLRVHRFETLPAGVDAFVSTRHGGVSAPPYDALNLGLGVGDDPARVVENRRRLLAAFADGLERSVWCRQVHSDAVVVVGEAEAGRGADSLETSVAAADALVTADPGLTLCVTVADCVPVAIFDPRLGVLGLVHAGWGGTVARICSATVAAMGERFGSEPGTLVATIGPSIGPDGYEVGAEVIERARDTYGERAAEILRPLGAGKANFDLWSANRIDLEQAGLPAAAIEVGGLASDQRLEDFYSHRREGGRTGRSIAAARLSPAPSPAG